MAQLLQNAAYGTALILAAALLRQALKDRLLPGARLLLWALCLLRLLTPVPLESALSLWGLFQPQTPAAAPAPAPISSPQLYIPALTSPAPAAQPNPGFPWEAVLPAAWLMVGLVLAARYVLSWTRTRRAVLCAIPVERNDPRYTPLPRCARLREGPMEGAPLTFGAVKPTVVLTPGLEGDTLDCVLAHEGVHARRRDNLWHYAMALALVLHWWNPAVWLMARLLRRDIELSCDRATVKRLGPERRADYANALLSLATQAKGPAFCQTFGRKATEERILSVMKFKKTSVIGVILSLTLVLAVTAAFASEPKETDNTVQFHGQTFSRSELSQETLDWLDWYLALPEDEQLAISYVPAELRNNQTPETQDAYDSEKVAADITSVPYEVLAYVQDLSIGMLREDVHKALGEPSFSFSSSSYSDCYELDPDSFKRQIGIFYNIDGTVAQVRYFSDTTDPDDTGIDLAHYLSDTGDAEPGYVLDGKTPDNVGVYYMTLDEYKVLLGGLVAVGKMTQEDADWLCAEAEKDLARYGDGTSGIIMTNETGGYAIMPTGEDQPNYVLDTTPSEQTAYPVNSKGKTYGEIPITPMSTFDAPDLVFVSARAETDWIDGYIPYARLYHPSYPGPFGGLHSDEFATYTEWLKTQPDVLTQPLYDCEENIIGEFRSPNPEKLPTVNDYDVNLPTFDEDGSPLAADGGITGNKFYSYESVTDPAAIAGGQVRTSSGTHALCDRTDCGAVGAHYHDEDGNTVFVYYADPGTDAIGGANSSTGIDVAEPTSDSSISPDLRDALEAQWKAHIQDQVADWLATHAS